MKITSTFIGTFVLTALATGCQKQNSVNENTTPIDTTATTLQNAKEGMTKTKRQA